MCQKKIFSRIVVIMVSVMIFLIATSSTLLIAVPLGATSTPDHIRLTWNGDPRTTQTISWRTDESIVVGKVQYAIATAKKEMEHPHTVDAVVESVVTSAGDVMFHSAILQNLIPGTCYLYRVGDGVHWSELHTFVTEAIHATDVTFLVFGDSQSSNYDSWRNTLEQAYRKNPKAVFFTNVGDLVDVGQDYQQWNEWFTATKDVIDLIPAMPVTGNHETYTRERKFSMPLLFMKQFTLPANGPEGLKGEVYSFDYGDIHFVVLDTQAGEEAAFLPSVLEIQKVWLKEDLASTHKKWKIIFMHRSPYNNKLTGNNAIRDAFVPILDAYHVDVVFTGHDHVYARTYPLYAGMIKDSAAQGTIYVATGRSGTKTYRDSVSKDWDQFFYNPLDEPNYIAVKVQGDSLTVKAVKNNGVLIDEWTIMKNAR